MCDAYGQSFMVLLEVEKENKKRIGIIPAKCFWQSFWRQSISKTRNRLWDNHLFPANSQILKCFEWILLFCFFLYYNSLMPIIFKFYTLESLVEYFQRYSIFFCKNEIINNK